MGLVILILLLLFLGVQSKGEHGTVTHPVLFSYLYVYVNLFTSILYIAGEDFRQFKTNITIICFLKKWSEI